MSQGYGQGRNPFADNNGYNNGGGLPSRPNYRNNDNNYGNEYGSNNVEMAPLTSNAESFPTNQPINALEEIRDITHGIDDIDQSLAQLKMLQQRSLDDADGSASSNTTRQLDSLGAQTMAKYRSLVERVRLLKSSPSAKQQAGQQIGRVDRRLKEAIQAYRQCETAFRGKTQQQMERQYRIVRPDADEAEIREFLEDESGGQVFQQALMQSNRRGQAQSVLNAVQDRHAQLQKINEQMVELAQLFQDMDVLVMQQEENIVTIEQKGEEVVDNLDKGNQEVGTAVNTARATRKKKWWCLGIVVAIIVIIVIILVVYFVINPPGGGNKKRSLPEVDIRAVKNLIDPEAAAKLFLPKFHSRINPETRRWLMSTTT